MNAYLHIWGGSVLLYFSSPSQITTLVFNQKLLNRSLNHLQNTSPTNPDQTNLQPPTCNSRPLPFSPSWLPLLLPKSESPSIYRYLFRILTRPKDSYRLCMPSILQLILQLCCWLRYPNHRHCWLNWRHELSYRNWFSYHLRHHRRCLRSRCLRSRSVRCWCHCSRKFAFNAFDPVSNLECSSCKHVAFTFELRLRYDVWRSTV